LRLEYKLETDRYIGQTILPADVLPFEYLTSNIGIGYKKVISIGL